MMLIALDENNRLLHIDQAERGLACNCTCFECGESVLARKGEIIEHHFAHANNKDSCVINPESLLHKYAKDIIMVLFAADWAIVFCRKYSKCRPVIAGTEKPTAA